MAQMKTAPKLTFTLLCDDVRQEVGGKYSLMGIFESLYAQKFPVVHPRFALIHEWTGGKGEFSVRVRLLSPDRSQILGETDESVVLHNEQQRHRCIALRFNTVFKSPGTYWIETLLDGQQAGLIPLSVQQLSEQTVH